MRCVQELQAANMIEVRNNLMATDIPVTVPRVMPGLFTTRVLVMRYIDGVKVRVGSQPITALLHSLIVYVGCLVGASPAS